MLVTFVAMVSVTGVGCSPDDWEASPDAGLDAAVTREDAGLVQEDAVLVQEDARFSIDPWSGKVSNTALPALSADGTVLVVAVGFGGSEHVCLPGGFDARFVRLTAWSWRPSPIQVGVHYGSCLCDSDSSVWLVQPGRKPRALF